MRKKERKTEREQDEKRLINYNLRARPVMIEGSENGKGEER